MAYIQTSVSVAANATNDNAISGNQFEFAPFNGITELGLVGSATGMEVDVLVGSESVVTRMLPSIQNRFPVYPDDFTLRFGMIRGDRIVIRLRNTTGGALTTFISAKMTRR
jgi:hypothetical protein